MPERSIVPAVTSIEPRGGGATRIAFVLHGIFGAGRNWRTWAARCVEARPEWRLLLVDLRHHGDSIGAPPPNTLDACAADLDRLAERHGAPAVVLGHSFGGKVALAFSARRPPGLRQTWVLDCPLGEPTYVDPTQSDPGRVLAALRSLPALVADRSAIVGELVRRGVADSVARWMATNLRPVAGGFAFPYDVGAIEELLADYWRTDGVALLDRCAPDLDVEVVRAANSDRFSRDELARLDRLAASGRIALHVLPDAGHFLQADNPSGLLDLIAPRLPAD